MATRHTESIVAQQLIQNISNTHRVVIVLSYVAEPRVLAGLSALLAGCGFYSCGWVVVYNLLPLLKSIEIHPYPVKAEKTAAVLRFGTFKNSL